MEFVIGCIGGQVLMVTVETVGHVSSLTCSASVEWVVSRESSDINELFIISVNLFSDSLKHMK